MDYYKNWTKVTEGRVSKGDPSGFNGNVHTAPKGYRDVFVNKIGKSINEGTAPYKYPVGTVFVKEQYEDKAAREAQKSPELIIMVKVANNSSPASDNRRYSAGLTDSAEKNTFCSGCHTIALETDFVFTNEDFFKKHP